MDSEDVIDGEWRELPEAAGELPPSDIPTAIRARARLAQAKALRDMSHRWQRGGTVISAPAPRLQLVSGGRRPDALWLASCGGSRGERARAAEQLSVEDFLRRPRRPCPPLRSI